MSDSATTTDVPRMIEQLCDHFERCWRQGYRPKIATYLRAVPGTFAPDLARALLLVEIDYRCQRGEEPTLAEYREALPQLAAVIDAVFGRAAEATVPPDDLASGPAAAAALNFRERTSLLAGRPLGTVRIDVLTGPRQGTQLEITADDSLLVGRDDANHLALAGDEQASRFHCLLEIRLPACYIRDLASRSGTLVNGQRIEGIVPVGDGDVITCGASQLRMQIEPAAAPPAPPLASSPAAVTSRRPRTLAQPRAEDEQLDHDPRFFPGYELERKLGKGGMGLVYLARELATGRQVALKAVVPEWSSDEEASRRFLREVSAIARLRHRRIVEFLEAGWVHGHLFLAMEYVEQVDVLGELAKKSAESRVRMACGLACQVLEGLRFAHGQSWVHRDLKPANVLVGRFSGRLRAKIADFGLAKSQAGAGQAGVTQSGQGLGTLPFMSPEQLHSARDASPLMDVYSLGATLYYWLARQPPLRFERGKDPARTILNDPPVPIREHCPDLPEELCAAIHRALAKNPQERFPSADAMWKALAPLARGAAG